MRRSIQCLALLVPATLAAAALTVTVARADDRYGPTDGRGGDYASDDQAYPSDIYRGPDAYDNGHWDAQSSRSRSEYERRDSRSRVYADERIDDVEQVDPCAVQYRLTGQRCLGQDAARRALPDQRQYGDRGEDLEQVDPCAVQYRMTGRRCGSPEEAYRGGGFREGYAWRSDRGYGDERSSAYDRTYDRTYDAGGYVEACIVAHERIGERCPYAGRQTYRGGERVVWVEERLPDSFFISEGGVGPGIVDYGGGGGGGGFAFADNFSGANASASASASLSLSIAAHNRHMMHYPHKMTHGGGCGCK